MKQNVGQLAKQYVHGMSVDNMRMLGWMSSKSRKNRIINESSCGSFGVAPISDKSTEMVWSCATKINDCASE